jgi:predicted ester cyclase
MSDENKAVARRFFEVFSEGNVDALDEIVAPDAVDHDAYNPFANEGLEGAKKAIGMYREAFPDLTFEIGLQVAEGDYVATTWTGTGTHNGPIMGIEPTGNSSTVTGIGVDRIEGGKVVESWNSWDTLGMMQSIGAIPQEAPAQA